MKELNDSWVGYKDDESNFMFFDISTEPSIAKFLIKWSLASFLF